MSNLGTWFRRFLLSSIPIAALFLYVGDFPWLLAFFYYLSLWIVLWSKDNAGDVRGGHPDQLGGPF